MVEHLCPYCGQRSEIPQLFPRVTQSIFRFIWENPGVDNREIGAGVYGPAYLPQTVWTHLKIIRRGLLATPYCLHTMNTTYPHRFRVIPRRAVEAQPQVTANGTQ